MSSGLSSIIWSRNSIRPLVAKSIMILAVVIDSPAFPLCRRKVPQIGTYSDSQETLHYSTVASAGQVKLIFYFAHREAIAKAQKGRKEGRNGGMSQMRWLREAVARGEGGVIIKEGIPLQGWGCAQ